MCDAKKVVTQFSSCVGFLSHPTTGSQKPGPTDKKDWWLADFRRCFFKQHLINLWNLLSHDVAMAASLDGFEKGIKLIH